jgi:hypothetical protein
MKHAIPVNDLKPHKPSADCHCHPLLLRNGNYCHHAFDTREKYERQGKPTKGWVIIEDNEPIENRPSI